ncbi:DUF1848 domain-containing protein [Bacteroidetes/Chlorobi group bacterium Naka2016]|nr:MAG: DUF1848 domain-containing protein [Bacteroidetes/Chlorobi group bacterium Naka2016]
MLFSNFQHKNIISVSRRTDIPAFYSNWFLNVLKQEYVLVENPFNHKINRVSLSPEDVLGFVFWSRYPIGLVNILDFIDSKYGHNHYINFTINDYPFELEPNKPKLEKVLKIVDLLFDRYGDNYIHWRFDPIVISDLTPKEYIIDKFGALCATLSGRTKVCITSFVDLYSKVEKRIKKEGEFSLQMFSFDEQMELINQLRSIANEFNIELRLCCESELSKALKIETATCVNPHNFKNYTRDTIKLAPTRKGCTCYKSIDIGFYNSCLFRCVYCYSNASFDTSLKNYLKKIKSGI